MAEKRVTSDDQRAADVAKVEREQYQESAAAEAADHVTPPAPAKAEERAEDLAEQRADQEDQEPDVTVRLVDDFEFPEDADDTVRVSGTGPTGKSVAVELKVGSTVTVPQSEANVVLQNPAVERVDS